MLPRRTQPLLLSTATALKKNKAGKARRLAGVDCLVGFMRPDLSERTQDYQYHVDGPVTGQAASVRGLAGIEKM